jgi:16S rRNA (cytosine1407-C5)-methyltransferase
MKRMAPYGFDRYSSLTDLTALKEASAKPLRKSLRVDTLKTSIEAFQKWAKERGWNLEQIPWCKEGFFVQTPLDTPLDSLRSLGATRGDKEEAFGRDLLHQLGHTYIQEAASMLPVELLDPKPGEEILDLCSAPGSKTTQIAARMQEKGVLVANDIQEKRLWVLKQALHRSGVTNVIVTKKVGQWFSKNMTERFDRVLCDAPCTAQGIVRKDPSALAYSSDQAIQKMATLQFALLESAIHAAKVGGRIVYSTCTLTPEENEGIVLAILKKLSGKIEIVDPSEVLGSRFQVLGKANEDSWKVQKYLSEKSSKTYHLTPNTFPALRLWPHTYDTEGFFAAVLRKVDRTRDVIAPPPFREKEKSINRARLEQISHELTKRYGTSFLHEGEILQERGEYLMLMTDAAAAFSLPEERYACGLPFCKVLKNGRHRLTHEIVTLRGNEATTQVIPLSDDEKENILDGKNIPCNRSLLGEYVLQWRNIPIGLGMAKEGVIKNWIPREVLRQIT